MNAIPMKLNHVDLVVEEIAEHRDFLNRWFAMTVEQEDESICLMRDAGGLLLILRRAEPGEASAYPSDFHLGFFLPDEGTVTSLFGRMMNDGVTFTQVIEGSPPKFRCRTPAGLLIEVAHVPGAI